MSSPLNLAKSHEGGREEVLQALIAGTSSPHAAAEALATISLSYSDREEGVGSTWEAIFHAARNSPKYHQKLVDLLVCISELPSPEDDQGRPIMLHDGRLWSDMPTLGWTAREQWDAPTRDTPSDKHSENSENSEHAATNFLNISRFLARMEATSIPALSFRTFVLWTMRTALEFPGTQRPDTILFVPAAAAWIQIAGAQILHWNNEYPQGQRLGAPGRGGPLWEGKHGFCRERWALWRGRFGDFATASSGSQEVRKAARQAEERMKEIEAEARTSSAAVGQSCQAHQERT